METSVIVVTDEMLRQGAAEGAENFLKVFTDKYLELTGGIPDVDTMPLLNAWQHSLLGYRFFCEEMDEGGFVQLIQNGYGPYLFDNPFPRAMRLFGAKDFSKLLYAARKVYVAHRDDLERDCDEDEFMAKYERYEEFDDLEEKFIDLRGEVTACIAGYVDAHLTDFARVVSETEVSE